MALANTRKVQCRVFYYTLDTIDYIPYIVDIAKRAGDKYIHLVIYQSPEVTLLELKHAIS